MKVHELVAALPHATPAHWRAIFAGALIALAGCPRCVGNPHPKCRRCKVDLATAGLAAFHLVGASRAKGT